LFIQNEISTLENGFGWKIEVKCGLQYHQIPDKFKGRAFVGSLKENEHKHVEDFTKRHVPPRHILLLLQE